jgi:hypothetical protein
MGLRQNVWADAVRYRVRAAQHFIAIARPRGTDPLDEYLTRVTEFLFYAFGPGTMAHDIAYYVHWRELRYFERILTNALKMRELAYASDHKLPAAFGDQAVEP